jgi:hypothetical protein
VKIEFSTLGDGTNIQVSLIEILGDAEVVNDRFYSSQHFIEKLYLTPRWSMVSCKQVFRDLEGVMQPPIIGGEWGHLHPYWNERSEANKRRL